jgi:predicted dehydrogenase
VHQNHRCDAALHRLIGVMDSGIIGRVFLIKMRWTAFARRNDWQTLRRYGGGTLNNAGSHGIDLCLTLMQAPVVDAWGDLQSLVTAGDTEDHAKILLRGANGRVIDFETSSAMKAPQRRYQLYGTLGSAVRDGDELVVTHLDPAELPPLAIQPQLAVPGRRYGAIGGDELRWHEKRLPAEPAELQRDFYAELRRTIRDGAPFLITHEELGEQMRINALVRKGTAFDHALVAGARA